MSLLIRTLPFILCFLISACSTPQWVRDINPLEPPDPVEMISPHWDAVAIRGDQIPISADIQAPYHVETIEVSFWNVKTGEREVLEFANTAGNQPFLFERVIEVPATLSPGADYRLEVTAYPREWDTQGGIFGYALPISIQ